MYWTLKKLEDKKTTEESKKKIAAVHAREILDSRGNPTVEADVTTEEGKDFIFASNLKCFVSRPCFQSSCSKWSLHRYLWSTRIKRWR